MAGDTGVPEPSAVGSGRAEIPSGWSDGVSPGWIPEGSVLTGGETGGEICTNMVPPAQYATTSAAAAQFMSFIGFT
jgi:hypothetical protein